ncbi:MULTISPECIES: FAD/NAD(P)-binding protein [unclassified Rhizobium]|uniref:FAD/NAD(P)-binding protein n=1 Tax=unclassified Rhizobium TaxID=2613769 RepID=UPI001ADB2B63|nr:MULTISPECIES: FAD/NAD(P)-binding protein [unclassified Rhizobium]MBO9123842.1 FAD/NAD(P)-binding protein [Rhizobium sp. 16-488-2b]MBO9174374.1 FAD/NAD(P)-binding protein [Rhizobium sp. 16-488-2a]
MTQLPSHFSRRPQDRQTRSLFKVAIVGRGFTGILTAIALLRTVKRPFHLVMYDPQQTVDISRSVSQSATTLLNSRVRDLSVDPGVRDDFSRWLEAEQKLGEAVGCERTGRDQSFVSGELFSQYVHQRFSEALQSRTDVVVQICPEIVTGLDHSEELGFSLSFGERQNARFDTVFLATGYGLRENTAEGQAGPAGDNVVVIGAGVRAVDRALRLLANSQARHVTLISASGFLPQSHARSAVGPIVSEEPFPRTLRGAFRHLRRAAEVANADGSGWQGIMNGFRSRAHDLWQELSAEERGRFKRHVRAIYDSHRNRLPPEHFERLHRAIADGAITLRKGKVERIASNGVLFSGPAGLEVLYASRAVDCRSRPTDLESPLYRSVLRAGLARRDVVDLGIVVDRCGRTASEPQGSKGLFAMGPLGLGSLPDIDLVPEIVIQGHAAAVALDNWIHELSLAEQRLPDE